MILRPGASFIKVAVHKKYCIKRDGMCLCTPLMHTAKIRTYGKTLDGKDGYSYASFHPSSDTESETSDQEITKLSSSIYTYIMHRPTSYFGYILLSPFITSRYKYGVNK